MPTPEEREEFLREDILPFTPSPALTAATERLMQVVEELQGKGRRGMVCICTALYTNRDCPLHGKHIRNRE